MADVSPSLTWLHDILWGDATRARVSLTPVNETHEPRTREWVVLPSAAAPILLVPTRGRAAERALFQFNDSMTQRERLAKAGIGFAIRRHLARPFLRDRLTVTVGSGGDHDLIEDELPSALGVPRVEVAISLGRGQRPNVKPVLQVMDTDGRVLAFAKLAWNAITADLVENEFATLTRLERKVIRSFRVPRVLHRGEWKGFPLVLLSPLPHGLVRRWPVNALPPLVVLREMADLGATDRRPLIGGPYWRELTGRALQVAGFSGDRDRMEGAIQELAADHSTIVVAHCMSHGDLAPWNMLHTRDSINVWDWERASAIRPLGMDVLHFTFEVAYQRESRSPSDALDVALQRSGRALTDLGVAPDAHEPIRDVYVLDRLTRLLEGRQATISVDPRLLRSLLKSIIHRARPSR